MVKIVIEVEGGVVQNVFSDDQATNVVVVDYDDTDHSALASDVEQVARLKEGLFNVY